MCLKGLPFNLLDVYNFIVKHRYTVFYKDGRDHIVSAATTLDIYSLMTDTMQVQAAVNIDRKIGKTDARMPKVEEIPDEAAKPPVNV